MCTLRRVEIWSKISSLQLTRICGRLGLKTEGWLCLDGSHRFRGGTLDGGNIDIGECVEGRG